LDVTECLGRRCAVGAISKRKPIGVAGRARLRRGLCIRPLPLLAASASREVDSGIPVTRRATALVTPLVRRGATSPPRLNSPSRLGVVPYLFEVLHEIVLGHLQKVLLVIVAGVFLADVPGAAVTLTMMAGALAAQASVSLA
jgi:hypothetical protein